MNSRYLLSLFLVLSFLSQKVASQSEIFGQVNIDTSIWAPVAYLSLIPDFDAKNTMSYEMIIDQAKIDNAGKFSFNTQFLPVEDKLYRIHISKRNDSPASLIIGGKDQNHFFLIASNKSNVSITDFGSDKLFDDIVFVGYQANQMLQQVDQIANYLDSAHFETSVIKIELIKGAIFEKLRLYADTCPNPLVALYALQKTDYQKNYQVNQQFYKDFFSKWRQQNSTYFNSFRKQLPSIRNLKLEITISIGILAFIVGLISFWLYLKTIKKDINPINSLSIQERKIFSLLVEGKSNKEISEALVISISTVKSHVYNLYAKLGIKSRKDVYNFNLEKNKEH